MRLIILFVFFIGNLAMAEEWDAHIKLGIRTYNDPKKSSDISYPELADRIENLFLTHSRSYIRVESIENDDRKLYYELYYSKDRLVVYQHQEGWNIVTEGNYVYEWKHGAKEGYRFEKNSSDLLSYIMYFTDPGFLMTAYYGQYLLDQSLFNRREVKDGLYSEISLIEPSDNHLVNILVNTKSLWFHGMRVKDIASEEEKGTFIHKPIAFLEIPTDIINEMKSVEFTESALSITRHFTWL